MTAIIKRILDWLKCFFGHHDWTCLLEQDVAIPSTPTLEELLDYIKLYCARCGRVSRKWQEYKERCLKSL